MRATQSRTFTVGPDDRQVAISVTQLPGRRGLRLANRLARTLGPAFARVAGARGTLADVDLSSVAGAVESLVERLTDEELDGISRELLSTATIGAAPLEPQIDLLFQGRTVELLRVLAFAFEVNFGDFFGALRGLAGSRAAGPPSSASTISSETGRPGDSSSGG